jgi:cytidylate kinase
VARQLARRLHAHYLDTGAMYRAATVAVLDAAVDPSDAEAVARVVAGIDLQVSTDPTAASTILNGRPVDREIRSDATTKAVSAVSAIPEVRTQLVAQQRALIDAGPTVAEGRDIGSVVWPQAELKVYLTARAEVRAWRRAGELGSAKVAEIAADISRRDSFDSSRATSPLRRTDDAIELDTSDLSIDEVVDTLVNLATALAPRSRG